MIKQKESVEEMEMRSWKRKLIGVWIFAIPIAILMMSDRLFMIELIPKGWMVPLLLILGFPVVFIFGFETLKGGLKGFYTFYFNMDSLIALGTVVVTLQESSVSLILLQTIQVFLL